MPETKTFYLGCIFWWITPVTTFLWWLAGDHVLSRKRTTLLTIAIPTAYLCLVDTIALRAGTWHITERTSTGIFVWTDLPLEEFTFFLVTNSLLVCGMSAFERCYAVIDVFNDVLQNGRAEKVISAPISSLQTQIAPQPSLARAFEWIRVLVDSMLLRVDALPASICARIPAFESTQAVLAKHSRSFYTASYVFPSAVRRDLVILYAFCRVLDDFCDESATPEDARSLIDMSKEFLDLVYPGTTSAYGNGNLSSRSSPSLEKGDINLQPSSPTASSDNRPAPPTEFQVSAFLHKRVPKEAQSSFFLLSTITGRIPRYPFDDLIAGYEWDMAGRQERPIETEADLVEYSRMVASSVAEMCVWAMWANEGSRPEDPRVRKHILARAASMGVALQITNIARDIREDAQKGRIYLPKAWFTISNGHVTTINDEKNSSNDEKHTRKAHGRSYPPNGTRLSSPHPERDFEVLEVAANSNGILDAREFPYAVYIRRLLDLAEEHKQGTNEAIQQLPRSCQAGIRAATRVYIGIGSAIESRAFSADGSANQAFDGQRISMTGWQRVRTALRAVYASM